MINQAVIASCVSLFQNKTVAQLTNLTSRTESFSGKYLKCLKGLERNNYKQKNTKGLLLICNTVGRKTVLEFVIRDDQRIGKF